MRELDARAWRPPWVLKPRSQAAAIGIKKIASADELWRIVDALGDAQADYVLEQFVPGDVYHVDSLVFDRRIVFAAASRYGTPPMAVAHEGGIFVTRTLADDDRDERRAEGDQRAASSTRSAWCAASRTRNSSAATTARCTFLETSARVGGAFIVDVVEAATGVNLWREWAKIEIAGEHGVVRAAGGRRRGMPGSCCRWRARRSRT